MSELPQSVKDEYFADTTMPDEERTQPSEEIMNALRQLQSQSSVHTELANEGLSSQDQTLSRPPSEWEMLRTQLRKNPVDADSWLKLVDLAEDSGDIDQIKETYEGLLEVYPNTSSAQIAYVTHFINGPDESYFQLGRTLFNRFLRSSPSVDLWKFYLNCVRRLNVGPQTRDEVRSSYEFALNHVGQDKDSSEIWLDYIQFLRSGENGSTWDEQQKMDAVRKAYQRAIQIPMDNVKKIWEDYQDFENSLNRITAKKFIMEYQASHMQARTVLNQLQEHLTVLFPPPPPSRSGRPPIWLPRPPVFNGGDKALVGRWRMYLKWEESNPLEIEEEDKVALNSRLQGVYRKAVIRMRFFAEIWFMAYVWTKSIGRTEEAVNLLKAGIEANPNSFVLNLAYAETLELNNNFPEVHATFEKFLDVLRHDLEDTEAKVNSANSSFSSNMSTSTTAANLNTSQKLSGTTTMTTGLIQAGIQSQNSSFNTQVSEDKPPKSQELTERRTEFGVAWIAYISYARRAEGLKVSRSVFGKARRDRWTPWQVYNSAALMEYHCTKAVDVASRIFEKGLEAFGDEMEFVLHYLSFLISVNDENNARALFERVITTFAPDKARPLWDRWARYVYQFGDLAAAHKLEQRIAEIYPTDPPIKRFAERHKYLGTDAIAVRDLGFVVSRQGSAGTLSGRSNNTLGRSDTQTSLTTQSPSQPTQVAPSTSKRAASPDHRKREESRTGDYGPATKRLRGGSPPPRERDRERWDGPPRRRHGTPPWERDRDRDVSVRRFDKEKEKDEDKGVVLPPILSWFVGMLPAPSAFDGPVFRTDDLMQVFRNAVIPASNIPRSRTPPPPPRTTGRPPPDYGPYQGPGGGRRGRY